MLFLYSTCFVICIVNEEQYTVLSRKLLRNFLAVCFVSDIGIKTG
jgi:hypothetical protein